MQDYYTYYVYILASKPGGTLYIGITNDIVRRVWEHKTFLHPSCFTAKYNVTRLVHLDTFDNVMTAIQHEKRLKKWKRKWKLDLITQTNPFWHDLSINYQHVA